MIETIYSNKKSFIILGLTGRIGSGCTTSADFLSKDIEDQKIDELSLKEEPSDKERKRYIIDKYYRKNWKPFTNIKASDIITLFVLKYSFDELIEILNFEKLDKKIETIKELREKYQSYYEEYKTFIEKLKENNEISLEKKFANIKKLSTISTFIKEELFKRNYKNYTDVFQKFGDNLRLYGDINSKNKTKEPKNIFTISETINKIIKIIRKINGKDKPTYITIDAVRNPLEAMFFKERYSAFYLVAINSTNDDIENRLKLNQYLEIEEIKEQSKKETKAKLLNSIDDFISQNIYGCIEKADIFIANNGTNNKKDLKELYGMLIKYICLIQHPGLITPSIDEKMMQVAYTAKLNSGCLSRQVGASITNKFGSLKSIGWNSTADKQTPCLLRNRDELLGNSNSKSYSVFEKSNIFKKMLNAEKPILEELGLNQSFCFKSIYTKNNPNEKGNQVHTRALHAEENAFLQIAKYGGEALLDGVLYSTASPCELCSKKAYQLGISKIVYIDPYPGIAIDQILLNGEREIEIKLFSGAIGSAYHKIYEQIIPFKDELKALTNV